MRKGGSTLTAESGHGEQHSYNGGRRWCPSSGGEGDGARRIEWQRPPSMAGPAMKSSICGNLMTTTSIRGGTGSDAGRSGLVAGGSSGGRHNHGGSSPNDGRSGHGTSGSSPDESSSGELHLGAARQAARAPPRWPEAVAGRTVVVERTRRWQAHSVAALDGLDIKPWMGSRLGLSFFNFLIELPRQAKQPPPLSLD